MKKYYLMVAMIAILYFGVLIYYYGIQDAVLIVLPAVCIGQMVRILDKYKKRS